MDHQAFLDKLGWGAPVLLPQDGTSRSYWRVSKGERSALLMHVPPHENTLPDFLRIGSFLAQNGVRVPEIYEVDAAQGLALIEDFGQKPFRIALEAGGDPNMLYDKAFALWRRLSSLKDLPELPSYNSHAVHIGRKRVMEWYLPAKLKRTVEQSEVQAYLDVWQQIEDTLQPYDVGFVHGDYHVDNIMVLADGSLGVIDFQDAMCGSPLYDLGNLLEDMRADVPDAIQARAKAVLSENDVAWIRVLNTQFHCRLLGQCLRWALVEDKPQYLRFLPRLEAYVLKGLQDPLLAPLKRFFDDLGLDFDLSKDLNIEHVRRYIGADAF